MTGALPPVWFRLPPGFHDIGRADRAALNEVAEALGVPEAGRQLARLMDGLDALAGHHVVHTSIGLHPDEPEGLSASLFSLAVLRAGHPNPRVSVARAALAVAGSALWSGSTRRFVDLASELPCALVAGVISVPGVERGLFQARAVTVHPEGRHVLVLDLTSAATGHAEAYTTILEAVTHTIAFQDPSPGPRPPGAAGTSRVLELL
ncbi:hypothetical protein ACWGDE_11110 [Streptomyces sp. NPDC054956]